MRFARSSAGFTLTELLVVMGLMGLVLVVVLNAKPKAAATRVAITARAMAATLQLARAQAMAGNTETLFQVDVDKLQFGLPRSMHALPKGMAVAITVADTEHAANSAGYAFFRTASHLAASPLSLEGRSARIAVNWLTGKSRLIRPPAIRYRVSGKSRIGEQGFALLGFLLFS